MAEKRKDNKGRLLKDGEYQRKNGRYEYKYEDLDGERRSAYSWKLVPTDRTPAGKRDGPSLREIEAEIEEHLKKGNSLKASKITLNECIEKYLSIAILANSTYDNYMYYYNKDIKDSWLGNKLAIKIKKSDVKKFYSDLSKKGYANGTVQIFQKIIHPALEMLVEDEVMGKNPSDAACRDYAQTESRNALTAEERRIFFEEIIPMARFNERYYIIFTIMKGLACRINEFIGLTWNDVSMDNRYVHINHGVVYRRKNGKVQYYATKGTDKNRERIIYMTDEVYKCFQILWERRLENPSTMEVDGYSNFVFVSRTGKPLSPTTLNKAIDNMVDKYKKKTGKDFPKVSNHIFRHTGCTEMAEAEVDPGALQYIMGHKDGEMIRKVYDSVSLERVRKQMQKLDKVNQEPE